MTDEDLRRCLDAMWDNSIDGRLADFRYGSDFDKQEADLKASFLEFLRSRDVNDDHGLSAG